MAGLLLAAVAAFSGATWSSSRIPADGDARLEAFTSTFVALGGTLVGAVVALAAVLLTLNLQRQSERQRVWAEFQSDVLRQSLEWATSVLQGFGQIVDYVNEHGHALDPAKAELWERATSRAQQFYDHEQNLGEVDRLRRLVDSDDVKDALTEADSALRRWNETVAGDHATRAVDLTHASGLLTVWGALAAAHERITEAYAVAVRAAYGEN